MISQLRDMLQQAIEQKDYYKAYIIASNLDYYMNSDTGKRYVLELEKKGKKR